MTHEEILYRYKICKVLVGSRAYGTHFESSDRDFFGVYCLRVEDLVDPSIPKMFKYENTCYVELQKYAELLIEGDLQAIEIIFTPFENVIRANGPFLNCFRTREVAKKFITKKAIQNWINTACILFNRAKRTGIVRRRDTSVLKYLNFAYSTHSSAPLVRTMAEVISEGRLDWYSVGRKVDLKSFGVKHLKDNIYALYESDSVTRVSGLLDEWGNFNENSLVEPFEPRYLNYRGLIVFDKTAWMRDNRYKSLATQESVANGYANKTMYHAFRIMTTALHYLKYSNLTVEAPEASLIMEIRRGNLSLDDLEKRFSERFDEVSLRLDSFNGPEDLDMNFLKELVVECRQKMSNHIRGNPVM